MRFATLFLLLIPGAALAQTPVLPELYSVTSVTSDDVLNIRAAPNAKAEILGELAPDARNIEVMSLSEKGDWAWVNSGESGGWVAMRYLTLQPDTWQNGVLPAGLRCIGTEPFWNLAFEGDAAILQAPDADPRRYRVEQVSDRGFSEDRMRAVQAGDLTAVIVPAQCSDGMSDRQFGLQAILSLRNGERPMLAGCCTIAP